MRYFGTTESFIWKKLGGLLTSKLILKEIITKVKHGFAKKVSCISKTMLLVLTVLQFDENIDSIKIVYYWCVLLTS